MIDKLIDYFTTTDRELIDWFAFGVDIAIAAIVVVLVAILLFRHVKKKVIILGLIGYVALFTAAYILDLILLKIILYASLIILGIMAIVYYVPDLRNILNNTARVKVSKQFLTNEETKEELINTIIKTVDHLSSRRIGAIITIEKEHSLNTYISKGVKLNAVVSFELLDTIFHPNTALHDGAVIIRGNQVMCANAFYPSSDKADIPQQYGSRHRAAIGISEVTDAFTIVVSEETGQIATTIGGTITGNISIDGLKVSLSQHIIVQ